MFRVKIKDLRLEIEKDAAVIQLLQPHILVSMQGLLLAKMIPFSDELHEMLLEYAPDSLFGTPEDFRTSQNIADSKKFRPSDINLHLSNFLLTGVEQWNRFVKEWSQAPRAGASVDDIVPEYMREMMIEHARKISATLKFIEDRFEIAGNTKIEKIWRKTLKIPKSSPVNS